MTRACSRARIALTRPCACAYRVLSASLSNTDEKKCFTYECCIARGLDFGRGMTFNVAVGLEGLENKEATDKRDQICAGDEAGTA